MRELSGAELVATYDDPFVRHQTDPAAVLRAYVLGTAAVVESRDHLPQATGSVIRMLGPVDDLGRLAGLVVDVVDPPTRIGVVAAALGVVPGRWRPEPVKRWHWMTTRTPPPEPLSELEEVLDMDEVNGFLDAFAPGAHARPGSPLVECWLGVRRCGSLLAVGALERQPDGTGHLRAVTVDRDERGRGLGREVSAGLTRRALACGSGVASLGVYADNEPALAVYHRLGYDVVHTFVSGPVSDRDPSRRR